MLVSLYHIIFSMYQVRGLYQQEPFSFLVTKMGRAVLGRRKGEITITFLSMLVFAVCANMDSFAVGLSYGLRRVRISWADDLLVGGITFWGTALSMLPGQCIPLLTPKAAGMLGGGIILLTGLGGLAGSLHPPNQLHAALQQGPCFSMARRQAAAVGAALTMNNIGLGVGAGIAGMPMLPVSLLCLGCSLVFLSAGNRLGRSRLAAKAGHSAELAANLALVFLGLYELLA